MKTIASKDVILDCLVRKIKQYHGHEVKPGPINCYEENPYLVYLGLTHMESTLAAVKAENGAVIDDALPYTSTKPDKRICMDVRVGTEKGQAVSFAGDSAPIKASISILEKKIDSMLEEAFSDAAEGYDDWVSIARRYEPVFVPNLVPVQAVQSLDEIKNVTLPRSKLIELARESSRILSTNGNSGLVEIQIYDEVRRMANSEGTLIRDAFFGYRFRYHVKARSDEKEELNFNQSLYFTDPTLKGKKEKILAFAKKILTETEKRKKCRQELTDGVYPVLYAPDAFAVALHESFVHFLSSEEILYNDSTTHGWENFGKGSTNSQLNVYSNPNMPGKWGSMKFDAEGVKAERRLLVEGGIIRGYLADRNGAYHLSQLTGTTILPGDARVGSLRDSELINSEPRISNLEFEYQSENLAKSKKEMLARFIDYLNYYGLEKGIYVPFGNGGCCYTDQGIMELNLEWPYVVYADGRMVPTKPLKTIIGVHTFLNNIVEMGGPTEYCPHRCGLGDEFGNESVVRAGISCPSAIVANVEIKPLRLERINTQIIK